jgi:N-methylhydantoinase B
LAGNRTLSPSGVSTSGAIEAPNPSTAARLVDKVPGDQPSEGSRTDMAEIKDPIAFELFKNSIFSIADEMALTICRTTYSAVLRDNMDFSTAFADADGHLVAQGLTLPGHLGSIPTALAVVVERFGEGMAPDDVFCLNDPFDGGMHLPDIFIFKPLFVDGERIAFAATICHHTDVGGRVAGSNASDSTEIYAEGLRIPPLKMYDKGVRNETLFALIEKNVRVPVKVFGDLRAQLAACHIAERQFAELITRFGKETVELYMQEVIDYAERLTRAAVAELPDGTFTFEDWIDDDGIDVDKPIRLFVTITKKGDSMKVDWTGTAAQVKGAINNTLSFTKAASYTAIRSILPQGIPNNEGVFRVIEVTAPPGTIANAVLPAACAARGLTGFRMVDCAFGALAMMVPDKVYAASDGGNTGVSIGGYDAKRNPFIYVDFTCGTWGGRPWADGLDGNSNMFANMASQSVEVTEAENPMQILSYEFLPDRAGVGKFRGGTPYRRDYRFLEEEGVLQVRSDRRRFRPYGLYGGRPGQPSWNFMNPETENRELPSKLTMEIRRGDVFRHELAGGGGWGDPLERDPAKVLRDVRNELLSPEKAAADYGVVVDVAAWCIDEAATSAAREAIRAARPAGELPVVAWEDPPETAGAAE